MSKPGLFYQIWESIHVPKAVTLSAVFGYLLTAGVGVLVIADRAGVLPHFYGVNIIVGGVMVFASSAGVALAWTGRWWVERAAVLLLIGALVGLGVLTWLAHRAHGLVFPVITLLLIGSVIVRNVERAVRVFSAPYEPGKTPQRLIREYALAIVEEERRIQADAKRAGDVERRRLASMPA